VASDRFGGLEKPVKRKERAETVCAPFLGGTASKAPNPPTRHRADCKGTPAQGWLMLAICLPIFDRVCRISAGRERFGAPKPDGVK
jgi:hypothetical protein